MLPAVIGSCQIKSSFGASGPNQAETHFKNGNVDLCESILEILIKYIETNKSIKFAKDESHPLYTIITEIKK